RVHHHAGSVLTVADDAHLSLARAMTDGPIVVLEDALAGRVDGPAPDPEPDDVALVLFTSGSTGTAKGVARDHRLVLLHGTAAQYTNAVEPDDHVVCTGSFAFTAAHTRAVGTLFGGGTLHIYDLEKSGLRAFPEWAVANRLTVVSLIPSVLRALIDTATGLLLPRIASARIVRLGGETLYGRDVRRARPLFGPDAVFRNGYGSSEAPSSSAWIVTDEDEQEESRPVPLGTATPWAQITIVGDDGAPLAAGEAGLIDVVHEHAALGYWRDPELTAERFWTAPDGRRGFHSGDRGRTTRDGNLEHLGRADDHVKIRAASVSPSQVERALARLDGVAHAAVVPTSARGGGTRLVAYVVPDADQPSVWRLRRDLAETVTSAMVPSAFVFVDALPYTTNGKVDRASLPTPPDVQRRPYRAPIGREEVLADLVGTVLAVDEVGLDDDFFDLGGDSLAAVELMAAIDEQFGVDLPPSAILDAPTVAQLAPLLTRRRARRSSTVVQLREGSGVPFFCVAGGGSPATSLRLLAQALPEGQACFGIQARGLEERARPDRSVEACARRYLADVCAVQPNGPYLLGGHSFGGIVAFEMARRLETAGEPVALLALLDSPVPSGRGRSDRPTDRMAKGLAGTAVGRVRHEVELASAGLVVRRLRQYRVFFLLSRRMARAYRPHGSYRGDAFLARAATPDPDVAPTDVEAWAALLPGSIEAIEITGTHTGILRRPHVSELGTVLGDVLARAVS
ncbi:MAG TPA: AMP-binding protein, partial [Acidimicrobiia bacterium]|nr:AMP-binding protein [Acidimicrobiia bacterium]